MSQPTRNHPHHSSQTGTGTAAVAAATAEPTSPAHTRQLNAQRAAYAAQVLHLHTQISGSTQARTRASVNAHTTDSLQEAFIELLIDLHHLCDTCDLDLQPLLHTAALVHTQEVQAA